MKRILFGLVAAVSAACCGDAANRLVAFSTPGPDRYADGATVLDGERYALVYVRGEFGGVTADAKAADADDEVLAVLPRAKGGRCPTTVFQVDSKVADGLTGGDYAVYMLDTRLAPGADGAVRLAPADAATGLPTAVAATTAVATDVPAAAFSSASASGAATAAGAVATADPADAPAPVVKSIRVEGAYVYLTVAGTIPALQYAVVGGESPDALGEQVGVPAQGAATADEEVTFVVPRSAAGGFFKVRRSALGR